MLHQDGFRFALLDVANNITGLPQLEKVLVIGQQLDRAPEPVPERVLLMPLVVHLPREHVEGDVWNERAFKEYRA